MPERLKQIWSQLEPLLESGGDSGFQQLEKEEIGEIQRLLQEYLDISKQLADRGNEAFALQYLAQMKVLNGENRLAEDLILLALNMHKESGDKEMEAVALEILGGITGNQRYYEEALHIASEMGNDELIDVIVHNLGRHLGVRFSRDGEGEDIDEFMKRRWQYEGETLDGEPHGQGTMFFQLSGDRYEGKWQNGRMQGKGTYFFNSGDRIEGEWVDGFTQGQAKYFLTSGEIVEGEWVNGRLEGSASHSKQDVTFKQTISDRGEFIISMERDEK